METLFYSDLGIILYFLSITISAGFGLTLLHKKDRTHPQLFLSITFFCYSLALLTYFVCDRYVYHQRYEVFRLLDSLGAILVVVASYLYFTSLMQPQRINKHFLFRNLFPYIIILTISIALQISFKRVPGLQSLSDFFQHLNNPTVIMRIVIIIYLIIYEIIITWKIINMYVRYRHYILDNYSFQKGIDLKWIPIILTAFCCLALLNLAEITTSAIKLKLWFGLFSPIWVISIFYLGSKQGEIPIPEEVAGTPPNFVEKNEILKERLLKYFDEKKPYLNKDLKMQDLAQALFTNRSYISQLFRKELNSSFYSFVNDYRIKYTIELMKNNPGLTVEHYADAAGFKSRSVFFSQFKEMKGCTPNTYLYMQKSRKINENSYFKIT